MEIIDTAQNIIKRRVKEAIYIQMAPTNVTLNRDIGLELSPSILRAVSHLKTSYHNTIILRLLLASLYDSCSAMKVTAAWLSKHVGNYHD